MRLYLFIDNVKSADEGNYTCYAEKQSSFNEYKIQLKTGVCVCVCISESTVVLSMYGWPGTKNGCPYISIAKGKLKSLVIYTNKLKYT